MRNMTVSQVLVAFVSSRHAIRVMHFPETDEVAEVLYEGIAKLSEIPDEVGKRIVSSIIAIDSVLCIAVYKEEGQLKRLNDVTQRELDIIAEYMDDCLREYIHFHYSPCTPEKFLREYIKREPSFEDVLKREFSVEV